MDGFDRSGHGRSFATSVLGLIAILALSFGSLACAGSASGPPEESASSPTEETASGREGSRPLEPRYQPREPLPEPWYNSSLIFGMTRGVTGSTIHPAGQVPLLVLTVPLDIAFLPFALIGGFF